MRRAGLAYIEIRLPQEVAARIDAAVKLSPGISTRTGWLVALIHRELATGDGIVRADYVPGRHD